MKSIYPKVALTVATAAVALASFAGVTAASTRTQAAPTMPAAKAALLQAELDHAQNTPKIAKIGIGQGQALAAATQPSPAAMSAGIVDVRQGPFSPADFTCRNMYRGHVGDRWLFVFVGASSDAQGQVRSAVRVYAQPDGGSYGYVGVYAAPSNVGALHVTPANGAVLTLSSDAGSTAMFDLAKLQYQ